MCGILGFSGKFAPEAIARANRAQGHRGPDDSGEFHLAECGIGLGHLRLSIIDLSHLGHQPMNSAEGELSLIFNGEIYNYRSLRDELIAQGVQFKGTSDTEVVLQLYLRDGEAMLPRLNGIFALAIWDGRSRSLFVARDQMGIKPVYYSQTAEGFAFASELKALLEINPGLRTLDIPSIHRYLTFLWCPGSGTPLKDVKKLQPGEALSVVDGKIVRQWTWYTLPAARGVRAELSEKDSIATVEAGLRRAVHRQLVADVPVGSFLSGGLDSSAVVAFAREQAPDIQCFSILTHGGEDAGITEDLPYARKVADHLGVKLHVVEIDAASMAADFEQMIQRLDEPLADPAPLNVLYISRLARSQGMKVLLSGAGGDDLFTGYRRHAVLNFQPAWEWIPSEVRRGFASAVQNLDQRNPWLRKLKTLAKLAAQDGPESLPNYFRWVDESRLNDLYSESFKAALGGESAAAPMLQFLETIPDELPALGKMLALEQRFFLADHNLIYTDKMSMAAGVEVRVPFLDVDLVEDAARIPLDLKQRGSEGKWVLKKAMEPYLPHEVIYRPKTGFGAPVRRWLRHELRPLVNGILSEESVRRRDLFDPAAVRRLISENESGAIDAAYTILSLMSIELWCRAYIDATVSSPKMEYA